jgi:hypothetical protein
MKESNKNDPSTLHKPPKVRENDNKKGYIRAGGKFFEVNPGIKAYLLQ